MKLNSLLTNKAKLRKLRDNVKKVLGFNPKKYIKITHTLQLSMDFDTFGQIFVFSHKNSHCALALTKKKKTIYVKYGC